MDHLLASAMEVAGYEHGVCGCCNVFFDGELIRSCIVLAVQADGHEITTIEGLGSASKMHPVQKAFAEHHGLQCGLLHTGDDYDGSRSAAAAGAADRPRNSAGHCGESVPLHRLYADRRGHQSSGVRDAAALSKQSGSPG
jgi:[2Fe-2S] binding domain